MKPAAFEYVRPTSIDEALSLLAEHGENLKILAGGQSLVPMLNLRLLRPEKLMDINGITSERYLRFDRKNLNIGMLARHVDFENNAELDQKIPIISRVVKDIAHRAIRNRGTFAGSVCHNDPSAEWPLMSMLLDAEMEIRSKKRKRTDPAAKFFANMMTTTLADDELLFSVKIPVPDKEMGWAFKEMNRRLGDFAIVSAAAMLRIKRGTIREARLALGGVNFAAMRAPEVEKLLLKREPSEALWQEAAELISTLVEPTTDLQATAEFRRHLAGVLTKDVLEQATISALRTSDEKRGG